MLLAVSKEYGALGELVGLAGSIMAAALAIALAWRGRTKWEPCEEDISKGPQKVGGLLTAVLVVIIWSQFSQESHLPKLIELAFITVTLCVLFLLAYTTLVATQTYQVVYSPKANKIASRNVIGGLWLIKTAKIGRDRNNLTTQELLKGAAYDVDKLWSRPSRAFAKVLFILSYLGLTVLGSIALTCASIILSLPNK